VAVPHDMRFQRDKMQIRKLAEPAWRLVSIELPSGRPTAAVQLPDRYVVPDCLGKYDGLMAGLEDWTVLHGKLRRADLQGAPTVLCQRLLMPLTYPRKVLCSGPNFHDHLSEMGETGLGEAWTSYFFLKPPTTTLIADGAPVLVSGDPAERPDWEGELAVVVGIGGRDIALADAMDHIAGYSVSNDISLRGPFRRDTPAKPFQWDWLAQKAADTSLPLGPGIVPTWLIDDVQKLRLQTLVNGTIRQEGWTGNMVFGVAQLLAHASSQVTLEPGDVILTGTPAGVGAGRNEFLVPGDVVTVGIEGVGSISNPIERRGGQ